MADLPVERLQRTPPFAHVGIDVFGHFLIKDGRRTRARSGECKIWVLIFSCLYSRAVAVEFLDSMDSPHFERALRRFIARWGRCQTIKSDRGSNFMGVRNEEDREEINQMAEAATRQIVDGARIMWEGETEWSVNPP